MATGKERLDKLVVDRGLCSSRAQAQALIMDGKVRVKGQPVTKAGTLIALSEMDVEVLGIQKYVSRGGLKLEKAFEVFPLQAAGRHCMDVGAATGGFTDCLLQNGAASVVAVDVGYGQLDWKLRQDERVTVLEKTHIRDVQREHFPQLISLGVVDTSFISLKKVLPALSQVLVTDGHYSAEIMALLKPQFEYLDYLNDPSFKGVVRQAQHHQAILKGVLHDLADLLPNWTLCGLNFSPITGPKGNIEFLLHYVRGADSVSQQPDLALETQIEQVIRDAHQSHAAITSGSD